MHVIRATQQMLETRTLVIGFQGENLRTQLRIDCSPTFAEYPNATPALAIKPPSGETYPVFVERDGNEVVWDIVANNLVLKGDGELQLTFYKDNVIAKTVIGTIRVNRSLQIDGEMPDVVATWIENANRKLAEVDAQIVELEGMVDTATDAAERAEQSASTASTAAEQAAGSAATATEKATEATNAAGTATAKAAEAQTAAQTATDKATAAAESERIATEKAEEITTAANTATAKAEQATEAAQTATEKAADASASATAAQTSATDAASSATAASASETAAKASETAAGASASQAAQSAQGASTATQTATQKAAEATQSATDAAASATNAATSAETASTKAGEAAQSAQAVAETAEQLADSLEQIDQNTQDIAELDERKANIDGYYPDMTVGNAEQLNSSKFVENSEPYTLRTSGGSADIGNREYLDAVVGGTVAWNQAVRDSASENSTDFADVVTVTDAVEDAAGVKVKIEPVQDLHGYDHPWPAGGGKNLFNKDSFTALDNVWFNTKTKAIVNGGGNKGFIVPCKSNTSYTISVQVKNFIDIGIASFTDVPALGSTSEHYNGTASAEKYKTATITTGASDRYLFVKYNNLNVTQTYTNDQVLAGIQLEEGATATDWTPYSNICPITGWTAAKVTRTGKNLVSVDELCKTASGTYNGISTQKTVNGYTFNGVSTASGAKYFGAFPIYSNRTFEVLANKTYVISYMQTGGFHLQGNILDKNDKQINASKSTWITPSYSTDATTGRNYAVFTPAASGRIAFIVNASLTQGTEYNGSISDVQLELASAPTDYEPFAGNTYDITLPTEAGTVYGGELNVTTGVLTVDRANVTFDENFPIGTVNWRPYSGYSAWLYKKTDLSGIKNSSDGLGVIISDTLPSPDYGSIFNGSIGIAGVPSDAWGACVRVPVAGLNTVASIREYLSEHPIHAVYSLATPITYTLTPTEFRTLLGQNNVWADTGDVALTYTGTDEHLTLESGKKYLARISGTDSMLLGSGQEITAAKGTDNVFDLTQMFGTAVVDYVYGQGAAFFRKWFPSTRYPYNSGELRHVEGLQSHDMVGFNQWDEEHELGYWDTTTGQKIPSTAGWTRSKNYIPVLPNTAYCFTATQPPSGSFGALICLDSEHKVLRTQPIAGGMFTTPNDAAYVVFYAMRQWFENPICISLVHNGTRNGEYEPYEKHSYPLDSTVVLRGIPKVGANGVYWDGDRYLPDGTIERRYGVVDLGTLTYAYVTNSGVSPFFASNFNSALPPQNIGTTMPNIICSAYVPAMRNANSFVDKCVTLDRAGTVAQIQVKDLSFTDPAAFKAAMQGVLLVYELETPTTETAQPYHSTQWVSDWGTEEFVSTGIVPVGTETRYPANLRDKLQHLPDAASGNGSYLITQTDGQMVLTPFPAPPSSAGNYVLKATVVNGVATYTWEVAT